MRPSTDYIAIHCSATAPDQDIGAKEIDSWHKARGWEGIGYHAVIRRNGTIEFGRQFDAVGAHVRGWNTRSVGVCLVGGVDDSGNPDSNFTAAQYNALKKLLNVLLLAYPTARIQGHRDFPEVRKDCPCFDVSEFIKGLHA